MSIRIDYLALVLLAACGGGGSQAGPDPDMEAPSIILGSVPNSPLSGTVGLTATADDNVGVAGVQFLLDGQPLGAEDPSAPYALSWNTTTLADGDYGISARARDAAGNQATSSASAVTVQNAPQPGQLIVEVRTSGVHLDPDGYVLSLDAAAPQAVSVQDTVDFGIVAPGNHQLQLSGRKINCGPTTSYPAIVAGPVPTRVQLSVTCEPDQLLFTRTNIPPNSAHRFIRIFETGAAAPDLPAAPATVTPNSVVRWSPDATEVTFQVGQQVAVMRADGTNYRVITAEPFNAEFPRWTPDGSMILYTGCCVPTRSLLLTSPNGVGRIQITPDSLGAANGSFSPAGSQLAFEGTATSFEYEIMRIDAGGGNVTRLTSDVTVDARADWSPQGDRIAFMTARDGTGITRIFLMDPDGGNQVQLTPDSLLADAPAWSPDGGRIAFVAHNGDFVSRLFLINPDGSGLVELPTPGGISGAPSWRPR